MLSKIFTLDSMDGVYHNIHGASIIQSNRNGFPNFKRYYIKGNNYSQC